jgi:1-acylglycerol-3-phosphate O-acyltransferase
MEKFTKFRDPGTGIAPFLPIAPGSRAPLILPLQLILFIFRIPLLFLTFGLEVILVEGVGELCLRKTLPTVLGWSRWLFLRTVLLLCGIWQIDEQLDGVSKSYDS